MSRRSSSEKTALTATLQAKAYPKPVTASFITGFKVGRCHNRAMEKGTATSVLSYDLDSFLPSLYHSTVVLLVLVS